jgi:hypothetical protein
VENKSPSPISSSPKENVQPSNLKTTSGNTNEVKQIDKSLTIHNPTPNNATITTNNTDTTNTTNNNTTNTTATNTTNTTATNNTNTNNTSSTTNNNNKTTYLKSKPPLVRTRSLLDLSVLLASTITFTHRDAPTSNIETKPKTEQQSDVFALNKPVLRRRTSAFFFRDEMRKNPQAKLDVNLIQKTESQPQITTSTPPSASPSTPEKEQAVPKRKSSKDKSGRSPFFSIRLGNFGLLKIERREKKKEKNKEKKKPEKEKKK